MSGASVPVRRTGRPRADATDAERRAADQIKVRAQHGHQVAAWVTGDAIVVQAYPVRRQRTAVPAGAVLAGVYCAPAPGLADIAADLRAAQAAAQAQRCEVQS